MDQPLRRLGAFNPLAAASLVAIYAAALAYGANSAAASALLAVLLLLLLAAAAFFTPSQLLARIIAANLVSLIGLAALCAYALIGAVAAFPHAPSLAQELGAHTQALSPYRVFEGLAAFSGAVSAFGLGALANPTREARDWSGRWLSVFALCYAGAGLWLFFSQGADERLDVGISSANAAAMLFGVLAIFASALVTRGARGRLSEAAARLPSALSWARFAFSAPLSLAALIAAISCLLLTASRGGLAATLVGVVVFVAAIFGLSARNRRARLIAAAGPALACVALAGLLFLRGGEAVMDRFALTNQDLNIRHDIAQAHIAFVAAHPWLGDGFNNFFELNTLAATPANWEATRVVGAVHNIYIQTLEEDGVVGLALFVVILAPFLLRSAVRVATGASGAEWSAAVLGASALIFLHGLVDFGLQVPAIAALYAFLLGAFASPLAQTNRR